MLLISVGLLALAAWGQLVPGDSTEFYSSDIFPKHDYGMKQVILESTPDTTGFTYFEFFFGGPGTTAYVNFLVSSDRSFTVGIQDCFCEGDVFDLYDFEDFVFTTLDGCNPTNEDTTGCAHFEDNVANCAISGYHCRETSDPIITRFHNFTINVVQSPLKFGRAYLVLSGVFTKKSV